jgi:MarR family transcriptional regulator, 2-MHQ and catechol-resistance regulon repressor
MAGRLQAELGKRRPFESAEQEAALALLRTADRLAIEFGRLFRRHGLTAAQYNVLRILRGEGEPMRVLDIAARTITEVPGITGLVDRLERAGLVKRERCRRDRRVVYVAATPKALGLLARLDGPVQELHSRLMGHLGTRELGELIRLLEKVRAPLDGGEG